MIRESEDGGSLHEVIIIRRCAAAASFFTKGMMSRG